MSISSSMDNSSLITGADAVAQAKAKKIAETAGKQTTDRGTLITKSNTEFSKNSFLLILSAQLKNQDPTQNQDSTAYVTQMAQFTSLEQMANLNDTMTTYSYQGLIGKGVTVSTTDNNGDPYTGVVRGVSKESGSWYLSVEVNENGKDVYKVFDASTLESVIGTNDYTNSNMLANSDFIAASNLAKDENNKVILIATGTDNKQTLVKGIVKSAYIDSGVVKVRVSTLDASGNASTETTDYPYSDIVKAGDLTDKDMDVKLEDYIGKDDNSSTPTYDTTKPPDPESSYDSLNDSKVQKVGGSSKSSTTNDSSIEEENQKLQDIING